MPATVVKGGVSVSGMYELGPVMMSSRSGYVKIDKAEEDALSAIRHLDRIACPVVAAYGDGESPEFKRQSRDFVDALKAEVKQPSRLIEVKGMNHFEIIETLGQADSELAKAALRQMELA